MRRKTTTSTSKPGDRILWDVVEEHLDEAQWEAAQFEAALDAPDFTLTELGEGPEERLLVQVDGIATAGKPAVDRILRRELEHKAQDSLARAQATVLALLAQGEHEAVLFSLQELSPSARAGALRGVVLGATPSLDSLVLEQIDAKRPRVSPATLLEIVAARRLRFSGLGRFLQSEEPEGLTAALRASLGGVGRAHRDRMDVLLVHGDPVVRQAAMIGGLHQGSRKAWSYCRRLALKESTPEPLAMMLVAGLGGSKDRAQLADRMSLDSLRPAVIRALGYAGEPERIPLLLEQIQDSDSLEARLAGEAIATIGGIAAKDYTKADVPVGPESPENGKSGPQPGPDLPPFEEDDLDADLELDPESYLPKPDVEALRSRWSRMGPSLRPGTCYLAGQPRSIPSLLAALDHFPLRRRHLLALVLSIRSAAKLRVDTRAFTSTQRRQLETAVSYVREAPSDVLAPF